MKKCFLLSIAIFACAFFSFAQVLKINQMQWNEDYTERAFIKEIQPGDEIKMSTEGDVVIFDSDVMNTSDVTQNVSLKLEVSGYTEGIDVSACWGDCLEPWNFNFRLVELGDIPEIFSVDYITNGIEDSKALVTCTFSVEGYDDLVFYIQFGESVSVNEPVITKNRAYPNPAASVVNIDYALNKNCGNAQICLYNILGMSVYEQTLDVQEETTAIDVSNFASGVYFYAIKVDGKALETKKVVISH